MTGPPLNYFPVGGIARCRQPAAGSWPTTGEEIFDIAGGYSREPLDQEVRDRRTLFVCSVSFVTDAQGRGHLSLRQSAGFTGSADPFAKLLQKLGRRSGLHATDFSIGRALLHRDGFPQLDRPYHAYDNEPCKISWGRAVPDSADFRTVFCARVRALRIAQGMTQAEMAQALGVGAEAYRAYENRAPMPHHLVEPFARITASRLRGCSAPRTACRPGREH